LLSIAKPGICCRKRLNAKPSESNKTEGDKTPIAIAMIEAIACASDALE
jgi:hypothetical protein